MFTAHNRWQRPFRRASPIFVAASVVLLAAMACSSGSGSKKLNATATALTSVDLTAIVGVPTTGPSPTPADPASLSYRQDTGPRNEYRVDVPDGWTQENTPTGRRYVLIDETGKRVVALEVGCSVGRSIDDMMSEDSAAVGRRGGRWGVNGAPSVTIGGLSGRRTDFVTGGATTIEGRTIYLASARCGWRLSLLAYVVGARDQFAALFDRVAQSFQEQSAGTSG